MPTILHLRGWRVFFYANEGKEPVHVHARRAETECKFWIRRDLYEIEEAWSHNMTPRLRQEIRKIIFDHLEDLVGEWERVFGSSRESDDAGN